MYPSTQHSRGEFVSKSAGQVCLYLLSRFLIGEEYNMKTALTRWEQTIQWREEKELDCILEQPHVKFDVIKRFYPHYFPGRAKEGNPIYIERPGDINLKALKKAGVTTEDLLWHTVFLTEFQWRRIEPEEGVPTAKSLSIIDIAGTHCFVMHGIETVTLLVRRCGT